MADFIGPFGTIMNVEYDPSHGLFRFKTSAQRSTFLQWSEALALAQFIQEQVRDLAGDDDGDD